MLVVVMMMVMMRIYLTRLAALTVIIRYRARQPPLWALVPCAR